MSDSIAPGDASAVLKILTEHPAESVPPAPLAAPSLVDGPN